MHLIFQCLSQFIHGLVPFNVGVLRNAFSFFHGIQCFLIELWHFNTKRKTATKNALMEKNVYCT